MDGLPNFKESDSFTGALFRLLLCNHNHKPCQILTLRSIGRDSIRIRQLSVNFFFFSMCPVIDGQGVVGVDTRLMYMVSMYGEPFMINSII